MKNDLGENQIHKIKTVIKSKLPKKRTTFKMPPTLLLLMGVIAFVVVLTWIIPSGFYSSIGSTNDEFYNTGKNMFGILDVFSATGKGFASASELLFYLMMSGALFGSITKSGALESSIGSLLKKFNGKELILVPIIMILFSIPGMVWGFAEETVVFYTMIIPIFVVAGFDAMTGFMVILVGAGVGTITSVTNPFMIGIASDSSNTDVTMGDGMIFRIISYLIMLAIACIFVTWYAWKVKNDPNKSVFTKEERSSYIKDAQEQVHMEKIPAMTNRNKIVMGLFVFAIIMMFMINLPWEDWGVNFKGWGKTVNGSAPWFTKLIPGLGQWGFIDIGMMFLLIAIIVNITVGLKAQENFDAIVDGAKDMMGVALVIAFARGVSIIMDGTTAKACAEAKINISNNALAWTDLSEFEKSFNTEFKDVMNTLNTKDLWELKKDDIIDYQVIDFNATEIVLDVSFSASKGISPTLLNGMSKGMENVNVASTNVISYLIFIPLSFLIPSTSGIATVAMPIMGPLGYLSGGISGTAGTITAMSHASGIVNLVTPTSGILMGSLAMAKISYNKYFKVIAPLLVTLFIVSIILLSLGGISIGGGDYLIGI